MVNWNFYDMFSSQKETFNFDKKCKTDTCVSHSTSLCESYADCFNCTIAQCDWKEGLCTDDIINPRWTNATNRGSMSYV